MKTCWNVAWIWLALRSGSSRGLDGADLCTELKIFREIMPVSVVTDIQCLKYLWTVRDSFPNTAVAYRILLTVPVTVASAERSFSKLKLIKNYLRSTTSQDRLCGPSILSIEKDIAATLDYNNLINEFSARKARKVDFRLWVVRDFLTIVYIKKKQLKLICSMYYWKTAMYVWVACFLLVSVWLT